MKLIIILLCSILEIPFIILAWIDYYWNLLCKSLAGISFIFALPSIVTMPITWVHGFTLATLIYIKQNLSGNEITYSDAIRINLSRFPEL
jgi:hypothetical protein